MGNSKSKQRISGDIYFTNKIIRPNNNNNPDKQFAINYRQNPSCIGHDGILSLENIIDDNQDKTITIAKGNSNAKASSNRRSPKVANATSSGSLIFSAATVLATEASSRTGGVGDCTSTISSRSELSVALILCADVS